MTTTSQPSNTAASGPATLLSATPTGTAAHLSIDLAFNQAMGRGTGSIFITDGEVQTVIDRVTGLPTLRIVGATVTREIAASGVTVDGTHIKLDVSGLQDGHDYSVVMDPGVLVTAANKPFAGVRSPGQVAFTAPPAAPPSATVTLDGTLLSTTHAIGVTIRFAEAVPELDTSAVHAGNATLTGWHTDDGGKTWQAALAPAAAASATANSVSIDMTRVHDHAGNTGSGTISSLPYEVDTLAPAVAGSIALDGSTIGPGKSIGVTIQFSEAVAGLDGALSAQHATFTGLHSDDHITWHATLVSTDSSASSGNAVSLDMSKVLDLHGNAGSGTTSSTAQYAVDPQPALTALIALGANTTLRSGATLEATITFSRAVSLLPADAFSSPNAAVQNLEKLDAAGLAWKVSFVAAGSGIDDSSNVLSLDLGRVQDVAGTAGSGTSTSANYTVDTVVSSYLDPVIAFADNGVFGNDRLISGDSPRAVGGIVFGAVDGSTQTLELKIDGNLIPASAITISSDHMPPGQYLWWYSGGDEHWDEGTHSVVARVTSGGHSSVEVSKTIVVDATLPTIVDPSEEVRDFDIAAPIVIKFSEAVYWNGEANGHDTVTIINTTDSSGGVTSVHVSNANLSADHKTLTISPDDHHLASGNRYQIELPAGLTDAAGNGVDEYSIRLRAAGEYVDVSAPHALAADAVLTADAPDTERLSYRLDDTLRLRVLFNEPVRVLDGHVPTLLLNNGGTASFVELGADGREAFFEYTVGSGAGEVAHLAIADSHGLLGHISDEAGNLVEAGDIDHSPLGIFAGDHSHEGEVSIDTHADAPLAPLLMDGPGVPDSDGVARTSHPYFSGTGAEAEARINLYENEQWIGYADADSNGEWGGYVNTGFANGPHTVQVRQTDLAGNQSTLSAALAFTVTLDTTPPAAPAAPALAAGSDSGIDHGDRITSSITPTFEGVATPNSLVRLYDGDTRLGQADADATGHWSFISSLAQGTHRISVTDEAAAGLESPHSENVTVTIDTTAPAAPAAPTLGVASDSGSDHGDRITNVNKPAFDGSAEAHSQVWLYDGNTLLGQADADASGHWSFASDSALGDGTHDISAIQVDVAGNQSARSDQVTITIDTAAPAKPTEAYLAGLSDTGIGGDGITANLTPMFEGYTNVPQLLAKLYDGNTLVGQDETNAGGAWTIITGTLAEGTHDFTVTLTDVAGNVSDRSEKTTVRIDHTAPQPVSSTVHGSSVDFVFDENIRLAPSGKLSLLDTLGLEVASFISTGSNWSIGAGTYGNLSVLHLDNLVPLLGATLHLGNDDGSLQDAAGNVALVGSAGATFTLPLLL
jgi:hypothetical protein